MQLYSIDERGRHIGTGHADKGRNYFCMECGKVVRLRSGMHRRAHFYHLEPSASCRLSGKSMAHLQAQLYIAACLPAADIAIEWRLPSIGRVADLAWFSQKIIFEIQYSPIASQEVQERIYDWALAGFYVVWILHEVRFNRWRLSGAEAVLHSHVHYFTDIDVEGAGSIYDQYERVERGRRQIICRPLPINPGVLYRFYSPLPAVSAFEQPTVIAHRLRSRPFAFSGDLFDRWMVVRCGDPLHELWQYDCIRASGKNRAFELLWRFLRSCCLGPYLALLRLFLERASR